MTLVEILITCIVILTIALVFSLYKLFKFSMILINIEDSTEACLDILDKRYKSISNVLEMPIFFDSMEVRGVIEDIRTSRDALLIVANKLTENIGSELETQKEDKN